MTTWDDVKDKPNFIKVLDKGFCGLIEKMGDDSSIVQAARVSYGDGTKSVREDRGLIRYLFKHGHTSPFEMVQFKFMIKCPIFVMRQLVRHRTASLNEVSARYSMVTDDYYLPHVNDIKPQSKDNKQGREGELDGIDAHIVQDVIKEHCEKSYLLYQELIREQNRTPLPMTIPNYAPPFSADFPGIAREIGRTVLPVAYYTELYWTQNLRNLFHLLYLRMDGHAQWEIQELARAIYTLIQPIVPLACEAFEDFDYQATKFSRMEKNLIKDLMIVNQGESIEDKANIIICYKFNNSESDFLSYYQMGKREYKEFLNQWK